MYLVSSFGTLQFVIQIFQKDLDDLNDGQDQRAKSQGASVVPTREEVADANGEQQYSLVGQVTYRHSASNVR